MQINIGRHAKFGEVVTRKYILRYLQQFNMSGNINRQKKSVRYSNRHYYKQFLYDLYLNSLLARSVLSEH
jgi:hypothetical protein